MSKFVIRTSGDGQESKVIERTHSEVSDNSSIKSTKNDDINSLGKQLLSNHLRPSTSSSNQQHLLFLDPSKSTEQISLPLVEPKGRKIYLTPRFSPQSFDQKMDTSLLLNRKKLKLVPIEPYTGCCTPLVVPVSKALSLINKKSKYSKNNLRISELMAHLAMEKELSAKSDKMPKDSSKNLEEEKEKLEKQLTFQIQVNAELKGLLVHCLGEDLQAKVNNLTEDKMKIASSLSSNTEKIEFLSSQAEVWRSKFLASSLLLEELSKIKTELTQRNNTLSASNKEFQINMEKIRIGLIEVHQNLSFLSNESMSNAKSSSVNDLMNEVVSLSTNLALNSGKIGLPRPHMNFIDTIPSTCTERTVAVKEFSDMQVLDDAYQAVCNQALQEYKREST